MYLLSLLVLYYIAFELNEFKDYEVIIIIFMSIGIYRHLIGVYLPFCGR